MTPKEIVRKLGYPLPEDWMLDPEQVEALMPIWAQVQDHNEKVVRDAIADATAHLVAVIELADQRIAAIKAAFGAPGDWGYSDPKGQALYELYVFRAEVLRPAIKSKRDTPAAGRPAGEGEP